MNVPSLLPIARLGSGHDRQLAPFRSGRSRFAALVCTAAALASGAIALAQAPTWTVVASGLNNPRGLDFAPNGALYIAEAGTGGNGPSIEGPDGPLSFGSSGSVTRVFQGVQERLVTGLPSLAGPDGSRAVGPSDISFGTVGNAVLTIGLGANPQVRETSLSPLGRTFATLWQFNPNGQMKLIADLGPFEAQNDPDGHGPDSNPNGVYNDRGVSYVADAGANAILQVNANGAISVAAVFPDRVVTTPPFLPQPPFPSQIPMQAVPTNVVRGPDGALYVSQLTGFPFPAGAAKIYRVVPGTAPTVFAEGFTNVIDLEFDAAGNLYVLEIDQNGLLAPDVTGRLVRVNVDHTQQTIASTGLVMPGGMAIGPDGAIYVSNFSVSPALGQVVRIQP